MEREENHPRPKKNIILVLLESIWVSLHNLIDHLESVKLTPLTAFLILVIIGVVRSVSESVFFEYPVFSMYLVVQHTAFNLPVLVMGVLILKLATDTPLKRVYTIIVIGFILVMFPPFIDYYILGHGGAEQSGLYAYFAAELTFFDKMPDLNFINMMVAEDISRGLKIMAIGILSSSGLYIFIKIRFHRIFNDIKKGLWKPFISKISSMFFGLFGIWFVIWFISAVVPTVFSFKHGGVVVLDHIKLNLYTKYYLFMKEYGYLIEEIAPPGGQAGLAAWLAQQQRSLFITMFFVILTTAMMIFTLWITHEEILRNIFKSIRKRLVLVTTSSALLGTAVLHLLDPNFLEGWALDPRFILHLPYIFYITGMGFFLGCFASFVIEYGRERSILDRTVSKHMAIVSILGGGSFAFLMGPTRALLLFSIAVLLTYFAFKDGKSVPSIFESGLFSIACMFLFLIGVYTPDVWKLRVEDAAGTFNTLDLSRTPQLTGTVMSLMLILIITVFLLSALPMIIEKMEWVAAFPGSLVFIPIFMLPAAIGVELITIASVCVIGFFVAIIMDKELTKFPMTMLGLCLLIYVMDLWGFIPSYL